VFRRSLLLTTLTSLIVLVAVPAQAGGDETGFDSAGAADVGDSTIELWATDGASQSPGVDVRPVLGNPQRCSAERVPDDFERERVLSDNSLVPGPAQFYFWVCGETRQLRWYVPGESQPQDDQVLAALVTEAIERVSPPAPVVVTSPPAGSQVLTGMPMYLAVDEGAFSEQSGSVSAGQFTVTATVTPVETVFVPGDDGEARTCPGSGTVWSRGDRPDEAACTHTYTHTPAHLHGDGDRFTLRARVSYEASYTVEGPVLAGTYDLGSFEGPESVVEVPVVERRAVRTSGS
jgi:hypothetical protein